MYSPFHKTLPKFILHMHRISVRFYEMGDSQTLKTYLGKPQKTYILSADMTGAPRP